MEAVFKSPAPRTKVFITIPVYADEGCDSGVELAVNRKGHHIVGTAMLEYLFCNGKVHDELTLTEEMDILKMRSYIEGRTGFTELSCDGEAMMLGGGTEKPTGADKHSQHKAELMKKYGEKEEGYSDFDIKLSGMMRKR